MPTSAAPADSRLPTAPAAAGAKATPPLGWPALLPPLATGAVLRLWNLGAQVLGGDELHPLRAALTESLGSIVTTYRAPDHYLPLAALARMVLLAGGTLDERWLRLPSLLAGLAAIVLVPRLAAPWIGRRPAILAAWLLALSPILVVYGRIARAYAPLVLLATVGALALRHWLTRGGWRWAGLYVATAALAQLAHPVALPTAVGPLVFAALAVSFPRLGLAPARGGGDDLDWRRLAALGAGLLAALALVLVPTAASLRSLAARRRIDPDWSWESLDGLLTGFAGHPHPLAITAFWGLAAWGLAVLARRDRPTAVLCALMVTAQLAGVVVLAPVGVHEPLMLVRYALTALPFLLLAAAAGLDDLATRAVASLRPPSRTLAGGATAACLLAAWLVTGPLAEPIRWRTPFAQHNDFVTFGCPRPRLASGALPAVYTTIRQRARPGDRVVELPWSVQWRFGRVWPLYHDAHRQPTLTATADSLLTDPRVRLRAVIPATAAAIRARGARFVVLHRNPTGEELALLDAPCGQTGQAQREHPQRALLVRQARQLAVELENAFGPPTQRDGPVWLWDLAATRGSRGERGSAGRSRSSDPG